MTQLSPHFSTWEFERSETASRNKISNKMPPSVLANAKYLCESYLEPIRAIVKEPVNISSGYRSPAVNRLIKGASPTSAHMYGLAVDIYTAKLPLRDLFWLIVDMIRYNRLPKVDQLIWEYGTWVHVGIKTPSKLCRGQIICSENTYFPYQEIPF